MSIAAAPLEITRAHGGAGCPMSQLDLACEAEISTRHLSFVETGRAMPSREMILHLAEQLAIPMRERNVLLVAAGYAPLFPEGDLASPELAIARQAIELLLEAHKPYPAFALDRRWNAVATNGAPPQLYAGVAAELLQPPVNVIRLSLHPKGLAPRIVNLAEGRGHLLGRLRGQVELIADAGLIELLEEVSAYAKPAATADRRPATAQASEMVIPLRLQISAGVVSFFSTTMVFGTPLEVTLSELALESFFPADAGTAEVVRNLTDHEPRPL